MAVTKGQGNPRWTREETILALDLYLQVRDKIPMSGDHRVVALSKFLQSLPYHGNEDRKGQFRNPAGVAFKLRNLHFVATGKGLGNVSATDIEVWNTFGTDERRAEDAARAIRETVQNEDSAKTTADEEIEFAEGRLLTRKHLMRERNPTVRKALLAQRIAAGRLRCEMCGCKAMTRNIALMDAQFEAHHIIPIAKSGEKKTKLTDMSLLCASCHRLLHRAIAAELRWLTPEDAVAICGIHKVSTGALDE